MSIVSQDDPKPEHTIQESIMKEGRTVTMETFIMDDRVVYIVWNGDSSAGDFGDAREHWRKEVLFGSRKAFRAGGHQFRNAAREQEEAAMALLETLDGAL